MIPGISHPLLDGGSFLAHCLANSHESVFLIAGSEGDIRSCNVAFAELVKRPPAEIVGQLLWTFLCADDAVTLRQLVTEGRRDATRSFLLNFENADHFPLTLDCRIDLQPGYFRLFAEAPRQKNEQAQEELLQLNNQLAVLSRENAQKNKELAKAKAELSTLLEDLRTSHWHLRKIQEVLPICMECGKVQAGREWQDVVAYLKTNARFLSHGYCPDCTAHLMSKWGLPTTEKESP